MEINRFPFQVEQPGREGIRGPRYLRQQDEGSFSDMVRRAIDAVDHSSKDADMKAEDVVKGKSENIHEVMIAMQKAQLSFQLMVEVRNKAIETYQELSRMQI